MEDLMLEPTKKTPLVNFFSTGKLIIAGSLYAENAPAFFDPLTEWIDKLNTSEVDMDLIIEYINTASAKQLLKLLLKLDRNNGIKNVKVNWFYHSDDEESLETGKILAESIPGLNFNYILYEDKKDL
jgi:hypothetical protein